MTTTMTLTTTTTTNTPTTTAEHYRFCSVQECNERQSLKQVHELEATVETYRLPQAKRKIDPRLAVTKYRRSAAGTDHSSNNNNKQRSRYQLESLLYHLQYVAATKRASPDHLEQRVSMEAWIAFLIDRCRACQSDATRLLGGPQHNHHHHHLRSTWHVQLIRLLLWIRYWALGLPQNDNWIPRTLHAMITTALEHYWMAREEEEEFQSDNERSPTAKEDNERTLVLDDEMLSWSALVRISPQQASSSTNEDGVSNTILLDFAKHSNNNPLSEYPLFQRSLELVSHVARGEYYVVWKYFLNHGSNTGNLFVLTRCCLAPSLQRWRYRTVQYYNVSFAKQEAVGDLPELLGIPSNDNSGEIVSFGLPTEIRNDRVMVVFKSVKMEDEHPTMMSPKRDDDWVFGKRNDFVAHPLGIASEQILDFLRLTQSPPPPPQGAQQSFANHTKPKVNNNNKHGSGRGRRSGRGGRGRGGSRGGRGRGRGRQGGRGGQGRGGGRGLRSTKS